ncbi:hypothetical protein [Nocardioides bruguierae]|uniref:Uncharacterized protein n=1 Tax=Nocardioides bruguierae TaxID=2945102 RepID=A0A9X2IED5_9ACTN|nr:hypothetical protein [Nocardioides bruguierae]MCL8025011.1 hypothetical protein [Nocardioides bruguierae]MCM0620182.1 hypothetical protein [Nocardioides bruguierae]
MTAPIPEERDAAPLEDSMDGIRPPGEHGEDLPDGKDGASAAAAEQESNAEESDAGEPSQ